MEVVDFLRLDLQNHDIGACSTVSDEVQGKDCPNYELRTARCSKITERCPSWPKGHDWKSCVPTKIGTEGSNPSLSAILRQGFGWQATAVR